MFTIEQSSKEIDKNVVLKVMDIESKVYKKEDRGDFNNIIRRLDKYPEMLVLARYDNEIVGYLCYFPISERLHEEIIKSGNYFDDNIEPKDVKKFEKKNYIFLISIAIYPEYQNKGVADMMMEYMNNHILLEEKKGNIVEDILTIVISKDGEKLAERYGFEFMAKTEEGYKVYRKVIKYEE